MTTRRTLFNSHRHVDYMVLQTEDRRNKHLFPLVVPLETYIKNKSTPSWINYLYKLIFYCLGLFGAYAIIYPIYHFAIEPYIKILLMKLY